MNNRLDKAQKNQTTFLRCLNQNFTIEMLVTRSELSLNMAIEGMIIFLISICTHGNPDVDVSRTSSQKQRQPHLYLPNPQSYHKPLLRESQQPQHNLHLQRKVRPLNPLRQHPSENVLPQEHPTSHPNPTNLKPCSLRQQHLLTDPTTSSRTKLPIRIPCSQDQTG